MIKHISEYNFPLAILTWFLQYKLPPLFVDIVRSTTMFIAISVVYAIIFWNHKSLIESYYSIDPWLKKINYNKAILYIHLHNFIRHFLPIILLGFPKSILGVFIGYIIYNTWYILVRSEMHKLYVKNVATEDYDYSVILTSICVLIGYVIYKAKIY